MEGLVQEEELEALVGVVNEELREGVGRQALWHTWGRTREE